MRDDRVALRPEGEVGDGGPTLSITPHRADTGTRFVTLNLPPPSANPDLAAPPPPPWQGRCPLRDPQPSPPSANPDLAPPPPPPYTGPMPAL